MTEKYEQSNEEEKQTNDLMLTREDVLKYHHQNGKPGKLEIHPTKPLETQRDLSLAYSPGVAIPVREIARDKNLAYLYTTKGNLVAVITNGTAILGLGNLGALASKPVMEGKAVLFKRFVDIDAFDIEVDTQDPETFINVVRHLEPSFGAINLEDIKAPECFIIEKKLQSLMDIPVFHDDQHGTAIICLAGIKNALLLTNRNIKNTKVVVNGAGAAGLSCLQLLQAAGLPKENAIICDSKGVIYKGRTEYINEWKMPFAADTKLRTLADAMKGADIFIGVSVKGTVTQDMVRSMNAKPILFTLANPDPEILPDAVYAIHPDAIVGTGRSDYPNQVNNVLCYPYIFRGILDVRARAIHDKIKLACADALATLARRDVPDDVSFAYDGQRLHFGQHYVIPVPFDKRLIEEIPAAVAKAAAEAGVARMPIADIDAYKAQLASRLSPTSTVLLDLMDKVRYKEKNKKIVFAEGEEAQVIKAAIDFQNLGLGDVVLVGAENKIQAIMKKEGYQLSKEGLSIKNAKLSTDKEINTYTDFLYKKLQRDGYLRRDCLRLVQTDRNVFTACFLEHGGADVMITGVTRHYNVAMQDILKVFDVTHEQCLMGLSLLIYRGEEIFVADTSVHQEPNAKQLAQIAIQSAEVAYKFGHKPRVAFLSHANFGNPPSKNSENIKEAIKILKSKNVQFEYDGEMNGDVALSVHQRKQFPFCNLSKKANILVMPNIQASSISTHLSSSISDAKLIGPMLIGLSKAVQIVDMNTSSSDIVNMAALTLLKM